MEMSCGKAPRVLAIGLTLWGLHLDAASAQDAPAYTQGPKEGKEEPGAVFQSEPVTPGRLSGDLRDLPRARAWQPGDPIVEYPRVTRPPKRSGEQEKRLPQLTLPERDSLLELQDSTSPKATDRTFTSPELNIPGLPFQGGFPPDTVGEVGTNHYIQMVNASIFSIYNMNGTQLLGPTLLESLWSAGGGTGACLNGGGDPIVLYDELADRWLMSEFADSVGGNHLCIYISMTSDPVSGGWFLYDFAVPQFPDYPKYGVWPDAYYVSSNESSPAVYALDRTQMLQGLVASAQRFTAPSLAGFGFQALTPSDLDGSTPPPAGSPNYFMRHRDDEVHNPGANNPSNDFLEIFEFHVDFATPANSSFTGPTQIPIAEFDSDLCGLVSFECFPQPSTGTTLDPLREVIMHRLQYRKFGTHESLVGNFVTDVDGTDHGGIRWFELRKTGSGPWTLRQEGTYAPDGDHRWMGSIAMDQDGNIALGYSVSSPTTFPSIRYAGRHASDPLGTLPQGEMSVVEGTFSQTGITRWGDYSSLNVDPVDGCTFWFTTEYVATNDPNGFGGTGLWGTQIATFQFDSCGITQCNGPLQTDTNFNLTNTTITDDQRFRASQEITTGPAFTVAATACVNLSAGQRVTLKPGSVIKRGASFTATVEP